MHRGQRSDKFSFTFNSSIQDDGNLSLEERAEAAEQLKQSVKAGDAHVQYIIGTAYRDSGLLIPDVAKARKLLERVAEQEIDAAQYALGELYLSDDADVHDSAKGIYWLKHSADNGNTYAAHEQLTVAQENGHAYASFFVNRIERGEQHPPSVVLSAMRLLYHMGNIFRDNAPAPAANSVQIDRKRLQELQRKRIALGHKPDDHEVEQQGYTMQFH